MPKALICDASATELAHLRTILDDAGWDSITASDGAEAVRKATAEKPALIFLDIVMPDMDGYEACRRLQANGETRGIPVVFASTMHRKADRIWARMQGGKTLIGKPYSAEQVLEALRAYG